MAYDEKTGERLRGAVDGTRGLEESRMFGGLTFLVNGNMCCGIAGDELIVRVDWDRAEELATRKHARPCDITGRPMRGLVTVSPAGFRTAAALRGWVGEAVAHARSLPTKTKEEKKKKVGASANTSAKTSAKTRIKTGNRTTEASTRTSTRANTKANTRANTKAKAKPTARAKRGPAKVGRRV